MPSPRFRFCAVRAFESMAEHVDCGSRLGPAQCDHCMARSGPRHEGWTNGLTSGERGDVSLLCHGHLSRRRTKQPSSHPPTCSLVDPIDRFPNVPCPWVNRRSELALSPRVHHGTGLPQTKRSCGTGDRSLSDSQVHTSA